MVGIIGQRAKRIIFITQQNQFSLRVLSSDIHGKSPYSEKYNSIFHFPLHYLKSSFVSIFRDKTLSLHQLFLLKVALKLIAELLRVAEVRSFDSSWDMILLILNCVLKFELRSWIAKLNSLEHGSEVRILCHWERWQGQKNIYFTIILPRISRIKGTNNKKLIITHHQNWQLLDPLSWRGRLHQ